MDEMKIKLSTKLMRNIVAKIISKTIFKKFGVKTKIRLNGLEFEVINGKAYFHVNVDGEMFEQDLLKVTRLTNLEEEVE